MIKRHSDGVNAVRLYVSSIGGIALGYTVGMFRPLHGEGRPVKVGESGVSDLICNVHGRFMAVEVKVSATDRMREDQENFAKAVVASGGIHVIADFRNGKDGTEAVKDAVDQLFVDTQQSIETFFEAGINRRDPDWMRTLANGLLGC